MLVNFKYMREFEDESAGFVLFKTKSTSESVEARGWDSLVWLGKNEVLELEDLAHLLLYLHVVIVAMVSNPLELLGNGGGLGH